MVVFQMIVDAELKVGLALLLIGVAIIGGLLWWLTWAR